VLMHRDDIDRLGLEDGGLVGIRTVASDRLREMHGFRVRPYDIPQGCIGTYYPEANALIPLWHHAERSKVPAAKSIPVTVFPTTETSWFK
jgi:anaerobic selenocysteine-containing dehydrogenase